MDRGGTAESRAARRFGEGQLTFGRRGRVVVTTLVVLWNLNLLGSLLYYVNQDDPHAALVVFLLGLSAMLSVVVLRKTWSASGEWRRDRRAEERARDRLELELRAGRPVNAALRPPQPGDHS